MRSLLLALMLISSASAELVWGPLNGDGPQVVGLGAVESGQLLAHQNLEMAVDGPGLGFHSETMHDHDAFFWFVTQTSRAGTLNLDADGPAGSASQFVDVQPLETTKVGWTNDGGVMGYDAGADGSPIYWWVTDEEGDLMAAAWIAAGENMPMFNWPGAADWTINIAHTMAFESFPYTGPARSGALDEITSMLEDLESSEPAAPCTGLLQEPAGDWFEDTHVRLSWNPAAALMGDGTPVQAIYSLTDADGLVGMAAARDPYGHALLRAPDAGAHTLQVDVDGQVCQMPINVMPSSGEATPVWNVTLDDGGFDIAFNADNAVHYDVDAIIRDVFNPRLVYAGKLHSHGAGIHGDFQVPPGTYEVTLFAVVQGEGPTMNHPMVAEVVVPATVIELQAETPAPAGFLVIALVALGLRRRGFTRASEA